jgi:cell division protein FtsB
MFDFQQKRKLKVFLHSELVWGVLGILTVFVLASAFDRYQIAKDMEERRVYLEIEAAQLEERKQALKAEVDYLSNERGIEAEMRRQFDVARDGEQVVIIVEEEPSTVTTTLPTLPESKPWYQFW